MSAAGTSRLVPDSSANLKNTMRPTTASITPVAEPAAISASIEERLRQLAYSLWVERGSPEGSPDADWSEAERLLKTQRSVAVNA